MRSTLHLLLRQLQLPHLRILHISPPPSNIGVPASGFSTSNQGESLTQPQHLRVALPPHQAPAPLPPREWKIEDRTMHLSFVTVGARAHPCRRKCDRLTVRLLYSRAYSWTTRTTYPAHHRRNVECFICANTLLHDKCLRRDSFDVKRTSKHPPPTGSHVRAAPLMGQGPYADAPPTPEQAATYGLAHVGSYIFSSRRELSVVQRQQQQPPPIGRMVPLPPPPASSASSSSCSKGLSCPETFSFSQNGWLYGSPSSQMPSPM
ncbi:hypothetical protein EDD18DRAFT_1408539 [Armillaria luteobubalina]|uniref:Uncharacterized protein n=1 Tax=Armillaria luteobubalina TaxID=153913 RepID=A0AA39ULI3_9AGAR|nr:hypothetical protein EDD18DRAFT_1408539 [Armillaria luteobubalina]